MRAGAFVLLLLTSLAGCTAPPPERSDEEARRPRGQAAPRAALIVDTTGHRTVLTDVVLRGAAPATEDDEWRFVELESTNGEQPVAVAFGDILRIKRGEVGARRLALRLLLRDGQRLDGTVRRQSRLEGQTPWGEAEVPLQQVTSVRFLAAPVGP